MIQRYALLWLGALLLGGCSVYTPMLGAAPDIKAKGELEATAAWSLTNRLDVGATYSPVRHLLVRAAASTKGGGHSAAPNDSSSYSQTAQYELAVGTYWPLGQHWLVGGLAGFGQAHAQARYDDDGNARLFSFRNPTQHQFDARYHKYSAEVYAGYQPSARVSLGLAYRVVQVRLTDVTDLGVPVQAGPVLRGEPMLFVRLGPPAGPRPWQMQLAVGSSSTFGYNERPAADRADPARQFKLGRGYLSVGVAFYPHVLWRKQ
ncbi:MAG TPA: hypothetical protein VFO93_14350 [Hymenobacter sp.]|uniref:hypothetical protein n=1 Tax=Hymenobacter sp. TaxID=1898978 RepID=UPI002D7F90F2|nr:hypothetical protein [Hymenobacter sp.]HET9504720.1 hypothetical protein [Hymenobacter sp.]